MPVELKNTETVMINVKNNKTGETTPLAPGDTMTVTVQPPGDYSLVVKVPRTP